MDLALESLDYADLCLINAPFTREVRDVEYMRALRRRLQKKDARLVVVWVKTDPEVVHQRMIQRNSDGTSGSCSTGTPTTPGSTTKFPNA